MALAEAGGALNDRNLANQQAVQYIDEAPAYLSPARESQKDLVGTIVTNAMQVSSPFAMALHVRWCLCVLVCVCLLSIQSVIHTSIIVLSRLEFVG